MLKIDAIRDNTVYIVGDEKLITKDEYLSSITEDGDCRLFVRKTNIEGIFLYGSDEILNLLFHSFTSKSNFSKYKL